MLYAFLLSPKLLISSHLYLCCLPTDIVRTYERCVIFLQGDFGNRYYWVTKGQVGLYATDSNDEVMR